MELDSNEVKRKAIAEYKAECFREAVDKYKIKLKQRKWWHRVVPWKIMIVRRK